MATTEQTQGKKNTVRARRAAHVRRGNARAAPRDSTIDTGTYNAYKTVLRSETQTSGSVTIRSKFASPTNGRAESLRLQRCTDRYSTHSIGAKEKTPRCNAEGARNPHAATVSRRRCGRWPARSPHAASATARGPTRARPTVSANQPAIQPSPVPGAERSSAHRP